MRYLNIIRSAERNAGPPPAALMQAIAALGAEAARNGVLVDTGGLGSRTDGALIRVAKGKVSVSEDGPAAGEELAGGYAIFETSTKEEAVALAKRFMDLHAEHWPAWQGAAEVRPVFGPPKTN